MEVSDEAIRENFQSKVDTELLELAASSGGDDTGLQIPSAARASEPSSEDKGGREHSSTDSRLVYRFCSNIWD